MLSSECLISRWYLTDVYFTFKVGSVFPRFVLWIRDCKLNSLSKFGGVNVSVPSKWNGISGNDWRTHSYHSSTWQTKKKQEEVWQTAAQSSWFIEAKMAIIKPQFYMRFKSICSLDFFFFSVNIFAENKVVTDKTRKREGQRQRIDRL